MRPKRLAVAALVAAVVGGFAAALTGFAAAEPDPTDLPTGFEVAAPMEGDRGIYRLHFLKPSDEGWQEARPSLPMFEFEWLQSEDEYDAAGQPHRVNPLESRRFFVSDDEPKTMQFFHRIERFDATSGQVVSVTSMLNDTSAGSSMVYEWGSDESHRWTLFAGYDPLCGLINPFQGGRISLNDGRLAFQDCTLPFSMAGGLHGSGYASLEFEPVAFEDGEGGPLLVVQDSSIEWLELTAWFSSAVPTPVQLAIRYEYRPSMKSEYEDGLYLVARLESFSRGDVPLARPGDPPTTQPVAPIEMAPRRPYGPDDVGVTHPFPLSDAYRRARDDTDEDSMRNFLSAHPEAFVEAAEYNEVEQVSTTGAMSHVRSWSFILTDGVDRLSVVYEQETRPVTHARDLPLGAPAAVPTEVVYRHDLDDAYHERLELIGYAPPSPRNVPPEFPTVSSMLRSWSAYAGADYAGATPNYWGFQVHCANYEKCTDEPALVEFDAGHRYQTWDVGTVDGTIEDRGFTSRSSSLRVYDQGAVWGLMEVGRDSNMDLRVPAAGGAQQEPFEILPNTAVEDALWSLPHAALPVAAGALGLFAALAYLIWPAIKQGVWLPLYSRLETPKALDHPTRAEIHSAIQADPGIHFQALKRRIGKGSGTMRHHLQKLVDVGMISIQEGAGYTCYFPKDRTDRRVMPAAAVLKSAGARAVLEAVRARPGSSATDLAAATHLTPPSVGFHLRRFVEIGLVRTERSGKSLKVVPTELAERAVLTRAS